MIYDKQLFTHHDRYHIHKFLGFSCLLHYFIRFHYLLIYYDLGFNYDIIRTITPFYHLGLSLSSFIFNVPLSRFSTKAIIWKELQLHNIIFISRSAFIMMYVIFFNSDIKELNCFVRFLIVISTHYYADMISNRYKNNDRTTTRDIPYNDNTNPIIIKITKKFYAISQILAICGLLLGNDFESPFVIMFPIHLSTFLMTLVRKSYISNNEWHLYYSMSLLSNYVFTYLHNYHEEIQIIKITLPLLYIFLRLFMNVNKYIVMILIVNINIFYIEKNDLKLLLV
jgi:hypothetical protein